MKILVFEQPIAGLAADSPSMFPIGAIDLMNVIQACADGNRAVTSKLDGNFLGAFDRVIRNFTDETVFEGLFGSEMAACEAELDGAALAHGCLDGPVDQNRPEADAYFGEAKKGIRVSDDDMGIGNKAGATGQCG